MRQGLTYQLLDTFQHLFQGQAYLHRKSNLGDSVAIQLYEDLYGLGRSNKFVSRVRSGLSVLNTRNTRHGIRARRGDGSFGEIVPKETPLKENNFVVCRGPIATIEMGIIYLTSQSQHHPAAVQTPHRSIPNRQLSCPAVRTAGRGLASSAL